MTEMMFFYFFPPSPTQLENIVSFSSVPTVIEVAWSPLNRFIINVAQGVSIVVFGRAFLCCLNAPGPQNLIPLGSLFM